MKTELLRPHHSHGCRMLSDGDNKAPPELAGGQVHLKLCGHNAKRKEELLPHIGTGSLKVLNHNTQ